MRKSKPAAMCLHTTDVHDLLNASVPDYMPGFDGFQFVDHRMFTAKMSEAKDLFAFIPRVDCETDTNYRQLIPYVIIKSSDGKILTYNRQAKGSKEGEQRLAGAGSIGFGGHIEIDDVDPWGPISTVCKNVSRELCEELYHDIEEGGVFTTDSYALTIKGILRSSATEVDKVHLGIILIAALTEDSIEMTVTEQGAKHGFYAAEPDQIINLRWLTPAELKEEPNMENWTKYIIESSLIK